MRKTERSVTLKGNKRKDRKFFKENWKKWNNNLILKCKFHFILCNSSLNEVFCFYSPSENKERNNGTSTSKEDAKAEENSSVAKPDKESSGAVDFDLALDYEEMDAAHSENEGEIKEDANAKSTQHSEQTKPKDDAESSDDSSGQGNFILFVSSEILL